MATLSVQPTGTVNKGNGTAGTQGKKPPVTPAPTPHPNSVVIVKSTGTTPTPTPTKKPAQTKLNWADKIVMKESNHKKFLKAEKDHYIQTNQHTNGQPPKGMIAVEIPVKNGQKIKCWQSEKMDPNKATLLYIHGNQNQLDTSLIKDTTPHKKGTTTVTKDSFPLTKDMIDLAQRSGLNILAVEPRGFAKQEGDVTTNSLLEDGRACIKYLNDLKGLKIPNKNIILAGHSLGGAVAPNLPEEGKKDQKFKAILINSAFPDSPQISQYVAGKTYPYLKFLFDSAHPESFKLDKKYAWNNIKAVDNNFKNGTPITIIQSKDDEEQPYYLAIQLKQEADKIGYGNKFKFITINDGGGHYGLTLDKTAAILNFFKDNANVKGNN